MTPLHANIIDVGGGESHFVDALLDKGYFNIRVLDISSKAIENMRRRLGTTSEKIKCRTVDHKTPFGTVQNFVFCGFQKK